MSNITLRVNDAVIKKVRRIALEKNTTLAAMVRDFLESVADREASRKELAVAEIEASFSELSRDMGQRTWTREELHER